MRHGQTGVDLESQAQQEKHLLKESYRDDDFILVCTELASSLIEWRSRAEGELANANGLDLDPVEWLDVRHPNWRDQIPL